MREEGEGEREGGGGAKRRGKGSGSWSDIKKVRYRGSALFHGLACTAMVTCVTPHQEIPGIRQHQRILLDGGGGSHTSTIRIIIKDLLKLLREFSDGRSIGGIIDNIGCFCEEGITGVFCVQVEL